MIADHVSTHYINKYALKKVNINLKSELLS